MEEFVGEDDDAGVSIVDLNDALPLVNWVEDDDNNDEEYYANQQTPNISISNNTMDRYRYHSPYDDVTSLSSKQEQVLSILYVVSGTVSMYLYFVQL